MERLLLLLLVLMLLIGKQGWNEVEIIPIAIRLIVHVPR